jgi:hypothetical protein
MAESVKRERYAALIHRLDAAQETLPPEMRVDTSAYKSALDFFSLHPGGGERAQRDINADWQGDPVKIRDELNRIHDPTEREQAWAEYRRSESYRDYVTKKYGPK